MGYLNKFKNILLAKIIDCISHFYLKKPDREEFLKIRVDSLKALRELTLNELLFLRNSLKSKYITSLNIEPTNICNLSCTICPVNNKMSRPKGNMDLRLFKKIISECRDLEAIQFSQWGEPLLNTHICEMIQIVKVQSIKTLLTTNGTLLNHAISLALLEAGLSRITFSIDGTKNTYANIRGYSYSDIKRKIAVFKKIRDRYSYPTKIDVSMTICQQTENEIREFKNEFRLIADRIQFIPVFTLGQRKKKCREPWRGSFTIYWDGKITVCCADYNGELVVGDATTTKLKDILNSSLLQQLRLAHILKNFPEICKTCSEYLCRGISPRFS
jgi:radical SAM protein with 4Fe4S-binding SPASM domain